MEIKKIQEGDSLTYFLSGKLDTITAPELEGEVRDALTGDVKKLVFDLEELKYISSAGLRVLMSAARKMRRNGEM